MKKKLFGFVLAAFIGCCTLSAQTPQELISYLPPINGWQLSASPEVFNPENLYDRINGGADAFLACNFVEMTTVNYTKNNSEYYITLQMYRHASPADAFCIYSAERSADSEFLNIGTEGYREPAVLYFLSGSVYVKMQTHDKSEETAAVMEKIARHLAEKIDASPAFPALSTIFPKENKEPYSEVHILQSFIGHRFLHSAYRATYKKDGKEYYLFVMDGSTKEGALKMLNDYLNFTKQQITPKEGEMLTITDRYNGDVLLQWQGQYLLGVLNDEGATIDVAALLEYLNTNIKC